MTRPFLEYLEAMPEPKRQILKFAARVGFAAMEDRVPAITGWTGRQRDAHLIMATVFVEHPRGGTEDFIDLIASKIAARDFDLALRLDLGHLGSCVGRWVRLLPEQAYLNHNQLFVDLLRWSQPSQVTQRRWHAAFERERNRRSL